MGARGIPNLCRYFSVFGCTMDLNGVSSPKQKSMVSAMQKSLFPQSCQIQQPIRRMFNTQPMLGMFVLDAFLVVNLVMVTKFDNLDNFCNFFGPNFENEPSSTADFHMVTMVTSIDDTVHFPIPVNLVQELTTPIPSTAF